MKFWSNATSTKKNSKKEWLLPTVLIANIVVFASLFFYDLNSSIGIGSRKEIGFVTFKKNAIQRKFDSSVVWINVGSNSPLANRDTLRTFENSDAVITLKNGTEIDVDQNSMIYIDIKDSKPKIKFEEGSIQVRKNKQNATSGITIESGGNLIKVGDAEAKIEKLAGEDLALYVNKGQVQVANQQGEKKFLQQDEVATVGKEIQIAKIKYRLLAPAHQARVITHKKKQNVLFTWQVREPMPNHTLVLSNTRRFKSSRKIPANGKTSLLLNLHEDTYYWKLEGRDTDGKLLAASDVRKFIVFQDNPVYLFSPVNRAEITYLKNRPHVLFSWQKNFISNHYLLQVATGADFRKPLLSIETSNNQYHTNKLAMGSYYWRVKTIPLASGIAQQTSEVRSFRLVQRNKFPPPKLLNPRNKQVVVFTGNEKRDHVLLNWRSHPEIHKFHIQISRDAGFQQIALNKKIVHPHLITSSLKKQGTYYWRVSGEYGKQETGFSKVLQFTISDRLHTGQDASSLGNQAGNEIVPIFPVNHKVDLTDGKPLRFAWKPVQNSKYYKFRIIKPGKKQQRQVFQTNVKQHKYTFKQLSRLEEGEFFWEVQAFAGKKSIGKKQTSRFRIIVNDEMLKRLKPGDIRFTSPKEIYKD